MALPGIKRKEFRKLERDYRRSVSENRPPHGSRLLKLIDEIHQWNKPLPSAGLRYLKGPALTWANLKRLPEEEIATQIAMRHLKAFINFERWPRKVTFANFESSVLRPLLRSRARAFDKTPVTLEWVEGLTPAKILQHARLVAARSEREHGERMTVKDALEPFWTHVNRQGFTTAKMLNRSLYESKVMKKLPAKTLWIGPKPSAKPENPDYSI